MLQPAAWRRSTVAHCQRTELQLTLARATVVAESNRPLAPPGIQKLRHKAETAFILHHQRKAVCPRSNDDTGNAVAGLCD